MVHADENPDPPAVEADERTARMAQATAVVTMEERPPDPATILHRLRTAFPHWGFVHNPGAGTWTALRGPAAGGVTIMKGDPLSLRMAVAEAGRGRSW